MNRLVTVPLQVLPALVYLALIFWLGSAPPGAQMTPAWNDKLLHAMGFGVLMPLNLLAAGALVPGWSLRARGWAAVVAASAAGGALEAHQLLFTRRSAEVLDWLADVVGIIAAWLLLEGFRIWRGLDAAPAGER